MVKKLYFYIRNIDIELIEEKYGLKYKSNLFENNTPVHSITSLNSLQNSNEIPVYSYLDETKKRHECYISTSNNNKNGNTCFWCRNKFDFLAIGCPIKFVNSYVLKKVYSNITKNCYTIKENIQENQTNLYKDKENYTLFKNGYFLTDGSFCSFNCCIAFIIDNNHDKMYNNSTILLKQFYYQIFNIPMKIKPAPSWKTLKEYGGHLTIREFRDSFKKLTFIQHHINENISDNKSIGYLFEKKINF